MKKSVIGLIVIVILIGGIFIFRTIQQPKITLKTISIKDVDDINLLFINIPKSIILSVVLDVENPNFLGATVSNVNYQLFLNNIPVGEGSLPYSVYIPANGRTDVTTEVKISIASSIQTLLSILQQGSVNAKVVGNIYIQAPIIGTITVPFNEEKLVFGSGTSGTISSQPYLSVQNIWWEVNGVNLNSAKSGDTVIGYITVKAVNGRVNGNAIVKIRQDISFAPDKDFASSSYDINLNEGETKTLSISFSPVFASNIRGYFFELWFNNNKIYSTESSYPPRLSVSSVQSGSISVSGVHWEQNNMMVNSVEVDSLVSAKATITSYGGPVSGTLKFEIRKDIPFAPDISFGSKEYSINLQNGESKTIEYQFTPTEVSGSNIRGYFVEITFNGKKVYTMQSSYPPRLTITQKVSTCQDGQTRNYVCKSTTTIQYEECSNGNWVVRETICSNGNICQNGKCVQTQQEGTAIVTNAYWTKNGQTITSANVGDNVVAHITILAQNGYVNGVATIDIRKDIALSPDQSFSKQDINVNIDSGKSQEITISFSPDQATGGLFRGYFIEVVFDGNKIYTMESQYPPRLTVS